MPENEVREMLYLLNTANLDCYGYCHLEREVTESGPVAFSGRLEDMDCRPYRTEVQLYKSLLFLKRSIDRDLIVTSQREALQALQCVISNIGYRFYKAYEMEIEDKRTVYGECAYRLVPREDDPADEPSAARSNPVLLYVYIGPAGERGKYGGQYRDQIQWAGSVTGRAQARFIHVVSIMKAQAITERRLLSIGKH